MTLTEERLEEIIDVCTVSGNRLLSWWAFDKKELTAMASALLAAQKELSELREAHRASSDSLTTLAGFLVREYPTELTDKDGPVALAIRIMVAAQKRVAELEEDLRSYILGVTKPDGECRKEMLSALSRLTQKLAEKESDIQTYIKAADGAQEALRLLRERVAELEEENKEMLEMWKLKEDLQKAGE